VSEHHKVAIIVIETHSFSSSEEVCEWQGIVFSKTLSLDMHNQLHVCIDIVTGFLPFAEITFIRALKTFNGFQKFKVFVW